MNVSKEKEFYVIHEYLCSASYATRTMVLWSRIRSGAGLIESSPPLSCLKPTISKSLIKLA